MSSELLLLAVLYWTAVKRSDQAIPVTRCDPAGHICEGRCPSLPAGAELPSDDDPAGLCLKEPKSGACVCWLRNPSPDRHLQTLFKCEISSLNGSAVHHVMCLPPTICFPPGSAEPGCLIVPQCPCTHHGRGNPSEYGQWRPVVAFILRSKTPVPASTPARESTPEKPPGDIREFSMKHLLFLLAFVIGPLLCWCLLTFFHEGKCRKKRPSPETEPMPTERVEDVEEGNAPPRPQHSEQQQTPTAPKFESPPPYREASDLGDACLLAADCGPPPSYEDAIRDQWQAVVHRIQDVNSE